MTYQASEIGTYYWRVIGVDLNGRKTRPGKRGKFVVRLGRPRLLRPANQEQVAWETEKYKVQLAWSPRPARRYQVQLASNTRFRRATTRSTKKPSLIHQPKHLGTMFWRVRCLEPQSEWSRVGQFQLVPMSPPLLAPKEAAVFQMTADSMSVELSWQKVPKATVYLVEIEQREPQRIEDTRLSVDLPPGSYRWSVKALDASGNESPPLNPHSFELRAANLPDAVTLSSPADGQEITHPARKPVALVWQPAERAVSYELEVATDGEFKQALKRDKVNATRTEMSLAPAQKVHWRIRALNQAGRPGDWSASRTFSYRVVAPPPKVIIKKPVPPPAPPVVHLAPHLSFFYNLGAVSTMRYGVELSYRLPVWDRRLAISLLASYYTASASTSADDGGLSADSRVHTIPLDLTVTMRFPTSVVDPYLGVGLNVGISHALVSMATQPELRQTDVDFGFIAVGGLEIPLGPGAAFLEFRYGLSTQSVELVEIDPGGLTFGAGYRIGIW